MKVKSAQAGNASIKNHKSEIKQSDNTRWLMQREKILSVASLLFSERGYEGTSIQDIANAAKINKATIYYYFDNKTVILYEVGSKAIETLIGMAQPIMNSGLPSEKKLEKLIFNQIIWYLNHPRNAYMALIGKRSLSPKLLKAYIIRRDYYESMFRELFTILIPKDKSHNFSPKIASIFTFGLMNSLATWYKQDGELSAEEIALKVCMFVSKALNISIST